jgi:hypothetical protein
MTTDSAHIDQQLLTLMQAVRENPDDTARIALNDLLRTDPVARAAMARLLVDEHALIANLRDDSIRCLLTAAPSSKSDQPARSTPWFSWRPFTAAAAGLLGGMICSTVVFGYITDRSTQQRLALPVFDSGLEGIKPLDTGLPHNVEEWGVRSAQIVSAERGVQPLQGQRMLRLEPALLGSQDENLYAHAYQILDLRTLPSALAGGTMEVLVSASFSAAPGPAKTRNYLRVYALSEPPGVATEDFWSKKEDAGVVSLTQRFEIEPGDTGWRPFSVKMPLPHGAQSLVIIFSATSPRDKTLPTPLSYLDDVQVSLLTSPVIQP